MSDPTRRERAQLLTVIKLQREELTTLSESTPATGKGSPARCSDFHSGRTARDPRSAPPPPAPPPPPPPPTKPVWSLSDDDSVGYSEDDGSFVFSTSERSQLLRKVELQRDEAEAARAKFSREVGEGVGTAKNAAASVAPAARDPGVDGGGGRGAFGRRGCRQEGSVVLRADDWIGTALPETTEGSGTTDADGLEFSPCSSMAACVEGRLEVRFVS